MGNEKKKQGFFETKTFQDVNYAQNEKNSMEKKLKRAQIGLGIAAISTLCMYLETISWEKS